MGAGNPVEVRRVYGSIGAERTGTWVLVDRLWPRGVSKAHEPWDEWAKDVAPSTELRTWFHHDDTRFDEFASRYRKELEQAPADAALAHLVDLAEHGPLTLLTASKDVDHSDATVLREVILETLAG
jgi:uncharacterized protein YeaO (DUF488 family)